MENILNFTYDNGILAVVASLLKYYHVPFKRQSLPLLDDKLKTPKTNIVLILIDGMGIDLIEKNLKETSFIRQHLAQKIYSVFPPTTTAATTAWHSGLSPWESGWIGWMSYYPQYDEIVENFRNTAYYSGRKLTTPTPINGLLKYETIYEKITRQNPHVGYYKIFPPFDENGVNSFEEMCEKIKETVAQNSGEKIISAYWIEPDHSVHQYGTKHPIVKEIIEKIDKNLEELCSSLADSLVIVSADHGAVDVEEVSFNQYPHLCQMLERPLSLESRFVTYFVKPAFKEAFAVEFNKQFGEDFFLFTKDEFIQTGLLGNGPMHPLLPQFLGDYFSIAKGNKSMVYSTGERVLKVLKADHAGISKEEMLIPLIMVDKK